MPTCKKCDKEFPNRVKVDGKTRILHKRKFCLECSPFGLHNTVDLNIATLHKSCLECGETDSSKFSDAKHSMCRKCHALYTKRKGKEKRAYAVKKLGSKCRCCGYDKFPCSLDIHHTDPSLKDENYDSIRGWSIERIDKELESCILLCKNCHTAYHNGFINESDFL